MNLKLGYDFVGQPIQPLSSLSSWKTQKQHLEAPAHSQATAVGWELRLSAGTCTGGLWVTCVSQYIDRWILGSLCQPEHIQVDSGLA